ncbi:ankyrin [Aspergillus uvarum CBS 121591]|uniref:Ankyrin n=1 Tax=Aspergillus uvarum CBS 121591 TaxID=1448315 RepID=A0A319C9A0_9EURO|nr:ankyrin [Aspergillus uvarum CBS 121591]PYH80277.1 ankyrin [Aspergillus uvarum CBS 121591]
MSSIPSGTTMTNKTGIYALPPELILSCAEYMTPKTALALSLTCKDLRAVLTQLIAEMRECCLAEAVHYHELTYLASIPAGHPRTRTYRTARALPPQPLVEAVRAGHLGTVKKALTKFHISPDSYDLQAQPLVHLAVLYKHPEIVEVLLQHGADPNVTSNRLETALDCWANKATAEDIAVLRLLLAAGAKSAMPRLLDYRARTLDLEIGLVEQIVLRELECGLVLEELFEDQTFFLALRYATPTYVRVMVAMRPILLQLRSQDGRGPVAYAADHDRPVMVACLVELGAWDAPPH